MRNGFGIAVSLSLLAATNAAAQTDKQAVATLEDTWIKAVIARDTAAFNKLLGPAFVYTEDGQLYARAQVLKDLATTTDTVTSGRNEELVVRMHGNTAIATGWLVLIGRGKGGPFERHYRYTDTWLKRNGAWRIIAAQDYLKK